MRISLDYYRILGLPIQATAQQLQTAHQDRSQQLPRREYSQVAIASRKQLLDRAYAVLSDPQQRQVYDASLLEAKSTVNSQTAYAQVGENPTTADLLADPQTPSIEIPEDQLVGSLLLLLELGEYELVLKLGRPHLEAGKVSPQITQSQQTQLATADIVLTIALACLELGREQWQQGTYQTAAQSLETGQTLLLSEGLFPIVRGEITADLYKLRPYRILELLAQPEEKVTSRRQGLQMLRDMLQERGGIDGTGDDGSGLGIDDFLRFVQQLRGYLNSKEQQTLFESESLRPSAVATYLAVYALLARGFANHQPALITRAKRMLMRLGSRQDVHLEQAVCALLLGQTEEASRALELSQEYEPLAFIREHSQNAPDLLPGLCLYSEHWLQDEVFPHFRDLREFRRSLKDYFADEQVQAYLEALPQQMSNANEWTVVQQAASSGARHPDLASNLHQTLETQEEIANAALEDSTQIRSSGGTATLAPTSETDLKTSDRPSRETRRPSRASSERMQGLVDSRLPVRTMGESAGDREREHRPQSPKQKQKRSKLGLVAAISIGAVLLFLGMRSLVTEQSTQPILEGEQPQVRLDRPPLEIPDANSEPLGATGPLTTEMARLAINNWLAAKREAFGPNYQIEQLEKILVDPILTAKRRQAEAARRDNWYGQYEHNQISVDLVEMSQVNADLAFVEATVSEEADFYENNLFDPASSFSNDNIRVRYELIRSNNQWRIQDIVVLN